ncbi:DDE 3 domain-containing protein [Aphis craccivora]|uniref:DDE 3 domain-containing protein n=1 Tax=Aphis craccivora TaxID=307492 RepID=A0A6G0YWH5_APHCR|nr:DDE 3 domain-containing protein [Aphis craccivora]
MAYQDTHSQTKKSGSQADYHSQMNATVFQKWFIDMLGNLEEPCIIVMDNATYHSTLTEEYPKARTRKADVKKWLQDKSVDFSPVETLSELREKAQVKGKVAEKNNTFKMADIEVLVNSILDAITTEDWAKCGDHCDKIQEDDLVKEGLRDDILEPIIMTINPDDSSTDEEDDEDDMIN